MVDSWIYCGSHYNKAIWLGPYEKKRYLQVFNNQNMIIFPAQFSTLILDGINIFLMSSGYRCIPVGNNLRFGPCVSVGSLISVMDLKQSDKQNIYRIILSVIYIRIQ